MSTTAYIHAGELAELVMLVKDPDGTAFDLTGYTIQFRFDQRAPKTTPVLTRTGDIKGTATLGQARYTLVAADWTTAGNKLSEGSWNVLVKLTSGDSSNVRYAPGKGFAVLEIQSALA